MSWREGEKDDKFTHWRCFCCRRQAVTTGEKPSPCVCSPAIRPKKRNTSGLRK